MSLLGQVIQPDASPSEDVQDMLVNGKNYKTMHSIVSFFAKTYIYRYTCVYRCVHRNNLYYTQVNCTTHSKMRN